MKVPGNHVGETLSFNIHLGVKWGISTLPGTVIPTAYVRGSEGKNPGFARLLLTLVTPEYR